MVDIFQRTALFDNYFREGLRDGSIGLQVGPDGEVEITFTGDNDTVNPSPCNLYHYQTTRFQVGTGGSANEGDPGSELSSTVSLGQPLTKAQYGNTLRSVNVLSGDLFSEEGTLLDRQEFGVITTKSPVASSVVHVWSLDEETANGQLLDEAGLFVHNPYLKKTTTQINVLNATNIQLVGTSFGGGAGPITLPPIYQPGHLLAAYRKFPPIKKENYFTLLFRWSISFPTGF